MKIIRHGEIVRDQPVNFAICGTRADYFQLNKKDIYDLLALDDAKLRERLELLKCRFSPNDL